MARGISIPSIKQPKIIWWFILLLGIGLTASSAIQINSHYTELARYSIADGKRIVVNIATGEWEGAASTKEMENAVAPEDEPAETPEDEPAENTPGTLSNQELAIGSTLKPEELEPLAPILPNVFQKRLSIIVHNLGLNDNLTQRALNLHPHVTLSFSPYSANLLRYTKAAEDKEHYVLLNLPTTRQGHPYNDSGPYALQNEFTDTQNLFRIQSLKEMTNYMSGFFLPPDETMTSYTQKFVPILNVLKREDMILVANKQAENDTVVTQLRSSGIRHTVGYDVLDHTHTKAEVYNVMRYIRKAINNNERDIILVTKPYPLTLDLIEQLVADMTQKGYEIAPINSIAIK